MQFCISFLINHYELTIDAMLYGNFVNSILNNEELFSIEFISGFIQHCFFLRFCAWYQQSKGYAELFVHNLFLETSKIFIGQMHYGHLLVLGKV